MLTTLILAALAILPGPGPLTDRVDVIELNHFYDEQGRLVFDQLVFKAWCDRRCRHQVVEWRLVKSPRQLPAFDHSASQWIAVWQDGEVMRRVQSHSFRESWTQYDVELIERNELPKECRRGLTGATK